MISTACCHYPANDNKPSARHMTLQPHIYSPSESHGSARQAMYPHLQHSSCPSPSYIYSGYEQYYTKDDWTNAASSPWSTYYPFPSRTSSIFETTVRPKVTIHPQQSLLVSDIDTPSSISSHSVLTPSSPFPQHDVGEAEFQAMEFDEFEYEDEEDYIDSDYADEMDVIEEAPSSSPLYGALAPHVIKSTSALAGALGDAPLSSSYDSVPGMSVPADRKLSASVPSYGSAPHRSTASQQRWPEKANSPLTSSSPYVLEASYPLQYTHTQRNSSSSSLLAPTLSLPCTHISSSSSLAGAFAPTIPSSSSSLHSSLPLPILQPQPIRPIPPIPLADLTSKANGTGSPEPSRILSPLPLLCQPISDAVLHKLKKPAADVSGLDEDDDCQYDTESGPDSVCDDDVVAASENDPFAHRMPVFCQEHDHHRHQSASGSGSMGEKMFSCTSNLPIRWQ